MMTRISLCPACTACPTVEVDDYEVRIGESGNLVRLTPTEWNVLVRAIKTDDLDVVDETKDRG